MKKICILLAAYNGEKWIEKQILTILNQKKVKIDLFISDDCSDDKTFEKIKKISIKKKNVFFWKNKTKSGSATQNFFNLIKKINFKKYDFISLSDQDDLWNSNKLFRAIKTIDKKRIDCYSSDVSIFYKDGKTKYLKKSQKQKKMDFLFEGGGPGSTFVLKKNFALALQNNLKNNKKTVKKLNFHDWYIYFYARINNYKWHIDNFSGLKYRQHENNQLGANIGFKTKLKRISYILNSNFLDQIKYFFQLNKNKKKYFKFLFNSNKSKSLLYVLKNYSHFRRKNIEKVLCLLILILFIFKRKSLL
jgi:rhamnosyltransferase